MFQDKLLLQQEVLDSYFLNDLDGTEGEVEQDALF